MSRRGLVISKLPVDREERSRKFEGFINALALPENNNCRLKTGIHKYWSKPLPYLKDGRFGTQFRSVSQSMYYTGFYLIMILPI